MTAFLLLVSAGTGPVEVASFVARLAAHLESACERLGLVVGEISYQGEEQRPRSVALLIQGDAPRLLAREIGTHALVERSPRRGRASRKRWFAGVSLHPYDSAPPPADIDPREVEITVTCASGPGGQHVNKTATAVRARHVPSGITVRVSDERSQRENKRRALARLGVLLAEREAERQGAEAAARRRAHYRVERGAPVRTYDVGAGGELLARG